MKDTIEQIIKHNTPEEATQKILKLVVKSDVNGSFTLDDVRKAFEGGRDSVEAEIGYEHFGDMEAYPKKKIVKSFKQWIHENYH